MINEILFMNGHGIYVWSAFAFTFQVSRVYIFLQKYSSLKKKIIYR